MSRVVGADWVLVIVFDIKVSSLNKYIIDVELNVFEVSQYCLIFIKVYVKKKAYLASAEEQD